MISATQYKTSNISNNLYIFLVSLNPANKNKIIKSHYKFARNSMRTEQRYLKLNPEKQQLDRTVFKRLKFSEP